MSSDPERRVTRWMAALALLPAPLWLLWAIASDGGPVWRAHYFSAPDFRGELRVLRERHLNELWDVTRRAPGDGLDPRSYSARWDTCLVLARAQAIPFQLVADGSASFVLDGEERLRALGGEARSTRGEVLQLEAGVHHLQVDFTTSTGSGVALNASLDGHAPVALVGSPSVPGVKLLAPRAEDPPCAAAH